MTPQVGLHVPQTIQLGVIFSEFFENSFKPQNIKLVHFYSLKRCKRDFRALNFEVSKMTPQVGFAVLFRNHYNFVWTLTPVAGSIFQPLSQTHISKSEFKNEMSSSTLRDIQLTLFGVCGVDSIFPEFEHL